VDLPQPRRDRSVRARTAGTRPARRRRPRRPGGKARARLELFALQRGVAFKADAGRRAGRTRRPASQSRLRAARGRPLTASPAIKARLPYLSGFAAKKLSARSRSAREPRWRELGPRVIPHGQTYGSGGNDEPPVSGRIASVAIDPRNPRRILIASAGGGLWESRDSGATWKPLTDHFPVLTLGALAMAPSDPDRVYVGTGEGDALGLLGVGILRSDDRGSSWNLFPHDAFQGQGFYDLQVDPSDPDRLWAATTAGLFESRDAGAGWTRHRTAVTWDLSIDHRSGELLAACEDGVFRSVIGATAWTRVQLPGVPSGKVQRIEVCHAPSDGSVAYVFAAVIGNPDSRRPHRHSRLWRRAEPRENFVRQPLPRRVDVTQAWYDWCAAVAPDDPDTIVIGAIELYRGSRNASGRWKWMNISSRRAGDSIHPDQHHIAFAPSDPRSVYVTNDGGLFHSRDLGKHWRSLNRGLGITEFEFLAQHPDQLGWILGGTQDNGTLRRRREGTEWEQVAPGDGGDCGACGDDPDLCVHAYEEMGVELSIDGGTTWEEIGPRQPAGYECLFYPPLEMLGEVIAQAGESLFVTENRGEDWAEILLPRSAAETGIATALSIPSQNQILVGMNRGQVYRVVSAGDGWANATLTRLTTPRSSAFVSDILVDDRSRIWVTYSTLKGGQVFSSDDGGKSWRDRSGNIPKVPVNAVSVDLAPSRAVFVGTDNGVYRSDRSGKKWREYGVGLPNAIVGDLILHVRGRRLRAGTRNRGAWEIKV
jgi:photosystem II stability/assembly factor-like uncharacterized protein